MIIDNNLVFSSSLTLTTDSTTNSYVLDLATGQMLTGTTYTVTPNLSYGNATYFGEDMGIGDVAIPIFVNIGTAFTTGNAATLNVQVAGGPQAGVTGTISSDVTFAVYVETGAIAASLLTANANIKLYYPHRKVGASLPRFIRLQYALATGQWTAGTINMAAIVLNRDDWASGLYPSNFVVAA